MFQAPDTYEEVIVNFDAANGYNGTDEYVVFAHSLGSTFQYVRIDEFNYEPIPACTGPVSTSLSVSCYHGHYGQRILGQWQPGRLYAHRVG
ncbi:MAG: hypothetical protein U5L96_02995 [Owenweeksia sp.]|nr:hypothetical protein [Owenweeksia sp.]